VTRNFTGKWSYTAYDYYCAQVLTFKKPRQSTETHIHAGTTLPRATCRGVPDTDSPEAETPNKVEFAPIGESCLYSSLVGNTPLVDISHLMKNPACPDTKGMYLCIYLCTYVSMRIRIHVSMYLCLLHSQ
jgi:hypothetical protein